MTPQEEAEILRRAAHNMENDPGIRQGRLTGSVYGYYTQWLLDEADMIEGGELTSFPLAPVWSGERWRPEVGSDGEQDRV